uniref:alanine--tRNA ligase n=1 Tax=Soboliphyme baturini TaxID=241478 RepID=A0A183J3J2_9BILA
LQVGDRGQVKIRSRLLKDAGELKDEGKLVCSICREGYKSAPSKLLAIYTFTKMVHADEFEHKVRKTNAYSTVTHFNIVHFECHQTAVRSARGRDEWESAMLQNANTRCNGLVPLWGGEVSEAEFAAYLVKHNSYIQEFTGFGDINFVSGVHDFKLLLLRFAEERSFSEETHGGGRESNIHLIPYLILLPLFVLNSTSTHDMRDFMLRNLHHFLQLSPEEWIGNSYECEGALYQAAMHVLLCSVSEWEEHKLEFLRRLFVLAHCRSIAPAGLCQKVPNSTPLDFSAYKACLMFYGLIDRIYRILFKNIRPARDEQWSVALMNFIRCNAEILYDLTTTLLKFFEEDLLPSESLPECFDVLVMSAILVHILVSLLQMLWRSFSRPCCLPVRRLSAWHSQKVRDTFINFFTSNGYKFIPSVPVVPLQDKDLLFVSAGVNQFKPLILSSRKNASFISSLKTAVNFQKCVRISGKHNDLEAVGRDGFHHTFFEMLGNWSFNGQIPKEIVCRQAWDLLTTVYKLPPSQLFVTYFAGDSTLNLEADQECCDLWRQIGLPCSHILPRGMKDNFWDMGEKGPCGPCTEIYYSFDGIPSLGPTFELWNIVFMQYNRLSETEFAPLPALHIDTGMGLERLCTVLQKVHSNYDTDLFKVHVSIFIIFIFC